MVARKENDVDKIHIDILAKRVLNDYLHTWLGNLIASGYPASPGT